jgi:hypothetical protein
VPRAVIEENSASAIDLAAMLNPFHRNETGSIINLVHYPIFADTNAILPLFAGHLYAAVRPRVSLQLAQFECCAEADGTFESC